MDAERIALVTEAVQRLGWKIREVDDTLVISAPSKKTKLIYNITAEAGFGGVILDIDSQYNADDWNWLHEATISNTLFERHGRYFMKWTLPDDGIFHLETTVTPKTKEQIVASLEAMVAECDIINHALEEASKLAKRLLRRAPYGHAWPYYEPVSMPSSN